MIIDQDLVLSDDQAIVADAASTNIIDDTVAKDIGPGTPIPLEVRVKEDFNTLTSLNVKLQKSVDEAFSSPIDIIVVNVLLADLVAGYSIPGFQIVPDGTDKQYWRMFYDVVGTDPTTGKIFAAVVAERQTNKGNL